MTTLRVRNWDRWQHYRKDRGQPPWIKIHRCLMRNPEWVSLTDAQRGQLVAIWLLAADRAGVIPASPAVIRKLCYMDSEPDLNLFTEKGFLENGVNMASTWRQHVTPETETETEAEAESLTSAPDENRSFNAPDVDNSRPDPGGYTDDQIQSLNSLRARIHRKWPAESHDLDRTLQHWFRMGAPFETVRASLEQTLNHCRDRPGAYLAKICRIEVPNAHEAAAIKSGFTRALSKDEAKRMFNNLNPEL